MTNTMRTLSSGKGQPVVFVHGAFCDARLWQSHLEVIGQSFHAIAVTLHGHYPGLLQDWSAFSGDQHAADLCAFLQTLETPAHVVGHSRGARISLHAASQCPQMMRSLILVEPGGDAEPDFLLPQQEPASIPPPASNLREQTAALVRAGEPEKAMHRYIDSGHGDGTWDSLSPQERSILTDNAPTVFGIIPDRTARLSVKSARSVSVPTLLIGGSDSPAIFGRVLDALQSYLPQSQRVSIEGADHFLPTKRTKDFNSTLLKWFSQ